jgi:hypothetical protein
MPVELIILAFVVLAFVAIGARFLPRDERGAIHLPAVVDDSIGMWAIRELLGRNAPAAGPPDEFAVPSEDEVAYRIGVPGAPRPTLPTRLIVSGARPQAHPLPVRTRPVATPVVAGPPHRRRSQARPNALVAQRRAAGAVAFVLVVVAILAVATLPGRPQGEVLGATGTPGGFTSSEVAVGETLGPTDLTRSSDAPSANTPLAFPSAALPSTVPASVTRTGPPTPVSTVAPTRTQPATPRPTASPKPTPTATAAPTPTPAQLPKAKIDTSDPTCGPSPLWVDFDGSASTNADTYLWNFGDGRTSTLADPPAIDFTSTTTVSLDVANTSGRGRASVTVQVDVPC